MTMITLYESNETDFTHNGICILKNCISAKATESLSGSFTLELEYPIDELESNELIRGRLIKCKLKDNRLPQLFRIRTATKDEEQVSVSAQHIAIADLGANFVPGLTIVGKTRTQAGQAILAAARQVHGFRFVGTDNGNMSYIMNPERVSPLKAMISGDEDCLLSTYGGEIRFNNLDIECHDTIGTDNGVLIAYGKNITGIEETIDDTDLITSIVPVGGDDLLLPEYNINSQYINNYEKIYFQRVEFNDIKVVESDTPSEVVTYAQAIARLREYANLLFTEQKADLVSCSYTINFEELSHFDYYKDYAQLETVNMGDTVTIKHSKLNINLSARVREIVYDILEDKLEEITVGSEQKSLTTIINETNHNIQFAQQKILLEVSNLDKTLSSKIEMTEAGILETVEDVKGGLITTINTTAAGIETKIIDSAAGLTNYVNSTAAGIRTELTNAKDGLTNTINTTAAGIDVKIANTKSGLETVINTTAAGIDTKITNTKDGLQTNINAVAGSLTSTITSVSGLSTRVSQTEQDIITTVTGPNGALTRVRLAEDEIENKVDSGDFGSLITQNATSITMAIKSKTNSKVIIDSSGLHIDGGGLTINDGGQVMWFYDGIARARVLSCDELIIYNTDEGSEFYNTLANMNELSLNTVNIWGRLAINSSDFYINYGSTGGWDLYDFIWKVVDDYCDDRGW